MSQNKTQRENSFVSSPAQCWEPHKWQKQSQRSESVSAWWQCLLTATVPQLNENSQEFHSSGAPGWLLRAVRTLSWWYFWLSLSLAGACWGGGVHVPFPRAVSPPSAGCGSWSLPSEPSITGAASECWKSVLNSPWNRGLGNWTRSSSAPLYPRDFWLLRYHMHLKKGEGGKNKSITSNRKCYFSLCFLCKSQPLTWALKMQDTGAKLWLYYKIIKSIIKIIYCRFNNLKSTIRLFKYRHGEFSELTSCYFLITTYKFLITIFLPR